MAIEFRLGIRMTHGRIVSEAQQERAVQDQYSLLDPLLVLAENARLLVAGPIIVGLIALGLTYLVSPTYTAHSKILPPQQQQSTAAALASQLGMMAGAAGLSAAVSGLRNPADMYVSLIKSRSVADRLIDRFNLLAGYKVGARSDARGILESMSRVYSGKDGLITIEVDDKDPKRAADLANGYVEELFGLLARLAVTEAQQRRVFFEKQLQQAQQGLKRSEIALSEVGAGEMVIKSAPQVLMAGLAQLKAQITAQEIRLSAMRGYMSESNPEFQQAQRELASLRAQLSKADTTTDGQNTQRTDYLNRYRDFKYQETLFDLMSKQYELARLDEAREASVIQVVDAAVPPERKSKPKRAQTAVYSTFGAGFFLLLFVFVRKAFSSMLADSVTAGKVESIKLALARLVGRHR